jgi:cation diffusion facilitator family transporter
MSSDNSQRYSQRGVSASKEDVHNAIKNIDKGIYLIVLAGLLNFFLGYFLIRKSKELKSITLEADGKHLMVDAYTSAGLIAGLVLIYFTQIFILDAIISFVLALLILFNGYKLLRKSISGLMDESDVSLVDDIVNILNVNRKAAWIDVHNLRVQKYGSDLHIDCHLTLPYYFDLNRMHDEVQELHKLIEKEAEATVEIFIHVDPCLSECCMYCSLLDCDKRTSAKTIDIKFDIDNIVNNAKHFASHAKI